MNFDKVKIGAVRDERLPQLEYHGSRRGTILPTWVVWERLEVVNRVKVAKVGG